jgi:hypothetical protein
MKKITIVLGFLALAICGFGQDSSAVKFANTITAADLKQHLSVLASDEYEGRETGKKGQKMAAEYIRAFFVTNKLNPPTKDGYLQPYDILLEKPTDVSLKLGQYNLTYLQDFFVFGSVGNYTTYEGFDFRGYGIDDEKYSDFSKSKEHDVAIIINGEPKDNVGRSLVSGKIEEGPWTKDSNKKKDVFLKEGYKLCIVVMPNFDKMAGMYGHYLTQEKTKLASKKEENVLPTIYISEITAAKIFAGKNSLEKLNKKLLKKKSIPTFSETILVGAGIKGGIKKGQAENVLAIVEGSDLINEIVILTAHYDHIGVDGEEVFNGADDDGSGTVAVMELAQAFKMAKNAGKGPRRTMVFMTVSGEEKGLLGSEYYTSNPVFPLENTVTNLNIDMIGRVDEQHEGNPNYVYLIGSDKLSSELHLMSEEAGKEYGLLEMDYTFNDPNDPNRFYYRSDHYNFAKNNIPVIFYFNGVHADYHKSTDTIEKIDFEKMEKISRLIFHTAWKVANADKRPAVDVVNDFE